MEYESLIAIIGGTIVLLFYCVRRAKRQNFRRQGKVVRGKVVDVVLESHIQRGRLYYPIVKFTLENGEYLRARYSDGTMPTAYKKGEEVTVYYQPDQPEDFIIEGQQRMDVLVLLIGLILLGVGLYLQFSPIR